VAGENREDRPIMRLAHNLPQHALFAQLEAVLRQMLSVSDMLLIRLENQRLERLYPPHLTYDDDIIGPCATAPTA
jgi:hypothetical protein